MFNNHIFKMIKSYTFMTVGLFIYVFSWTAFLIPQQIAGGGLSGLGSVINYATGFPIAYSYLIINAFLLLIGLTILGGAFGIKTIYCIIVTTLFFKFLPLIPWVTDIGDKLINAVLGGTISGIGIGIIFMQGGSTGGTDIIALIIGKYRETTPGRVFLYSDMIIVGSMFFLPGKGLSDVIYGYIVMVSFSYVIDTILSGNKQSVQAMIYSSKYDEIAEKINSKLGRGVTALSSTGWFSKQEGKVLVVILRKVQMPLLSEIVKNTDENAFMSVSAVTSVYGRGFDQIKDRKIKWKKEQKQS